MRDTTEYFWTSAPIPQQWRAIGVNEEDISLHEREGNMEEDGEMDRDDDNYLDGDWI